MTRVEKVKVAFCGEWEEKMSKFVLATAALLKTGVTGFGTTSHY